MVTTSFFRLKQKLELYGSVFSKSTKGKAPLPSIFHQWKFGECFLCLLICSTRCVDAKIGKLFAQPFPLWFCLSKDQSNGKTFLSCVITESNLLQFEIFLLHLFVELLEELIIKANERFLCFLHISLGLN